MSYVSKIDHFIFGRRCWRLRACYSPVESINGGADLDAGWLADTLAFLRSWGSMQVGTIDDGAALEGSR